MKVFWRASNTTSFCYVKKHHNQFREKYVNMNKLDLSMRHLPMRVVCKHGCGVKLFTQSRI